MIRKQVVRAFAALFEGLEDENGDVVTVERGRDTPISSYPFLAIEEGGERGSEESYGEQTLVMSISVLGFVNVPPREADTAPAGAEMMDALTDLYGRVVRAALADDRQLGGLVNDIRFVSFTPDIAMDTGTNAGSFEAAFEIDYWTAPGNPFSQTIGD